MKRAIVECVPDVRIARPDVSHALAAVIARAIAKEREDRPADCCSLAAKLRAAQRFSVAETIIAVPTLNDPLAAALTAAPTMLAREALRTI